MLPVKSNLIDTGCSPVSSNCVIWQGPCLLCIGVNTGDVISDVIATLANSICDLTANINLTQIDFKCLVDLSLETPQPEKTLNTAITLLINKVCDLQTIIDSIVPPPDPTPDMITVATCFQTLDLNGDPILSLPIDDYVRAIGNKVCTIAATVASQGTTISSQGTTLTSYGTRITNLENTALTYLPTVTPTCIYGGDTSAKAMNVFLQALEVQFCTLRSATGTSTALLNAAAEQCSGLNSAAALSVSGTMSGISGWKSTVSTVADSLTNMWLTICDMRTAISAIQGCCSKTCADVIVNFVANITDNGATIKLYFAGYTFLPSGFTDCSEGGSVLTITDGISGSYTTNVVLSTASISSTPISIDVTSTPLSPTGSYTLNLASCITNGTLTCNKSVIVKVTGTPLSCNPPSNVTATLS